MHSCFETPHQAVPAASTTVSEPNNSTLSSALSAVYLVGLFGGQTQSRRACSVLVHAIKQRPEWETLGKSAGGEYLFHAALSANAGPTRSVHSICTPARVCSHLSHWLLLTCHKVRASRPRLVASQKQPMAQV